MNIVSLPVDDGGCGWYRVRQLLKEIGKDKNHSIHIASNKDGVEFLYILDRADIIICRPGVHIRKFKNEMLSIMENFNREAGANLSIHARFVMDIDDNVEAISPYSVHYVEYGIADFYDKNSKVQLFKDGENGFSIDKNRKKLKTLLTSLRDADMVTVTTDELAKYARQFNRNVAIIPNAIDLTAWWRINHYPNEQLRVGWSGGLSHYEDWFEIKGPLNELMRRFQFKLVVAGQTFDGLIDKDNQHLVESYGWTAFQAHSFRMMAFCLDIMIIPLADLPFNSFKSPIKWLEASALGVPSVVSNVKPYSVVATEQTACLFSSPGSFYARVEELINSKTKREQIGAASRRYVEDNFSLSAIAKKALEAYSSLLRK